MFIRNFLRGTQALLRDILQTPRYLHKSPKMRLTQMDYEDYWKLRGRHSFQPRYEIMARMIEPGASVLDIGCGDGFLLEYLARLKKVQGYGVDISVEAITMAKERKVKAEAVNIFEWESDQVYDYIIISEFIEHVPNPEDLIRKLRKGCRKAFLISVPNIGYYQHRLRLLFGRFPVQWVIHPAEHLRFWTVIDFQEWARQLGLEVIEVQSSNGIPFIHRYLPNLFGNQIVFLLRPSNSSFQDYP
jgi:methionine biosynthesis protein MetW